MITQTDVILMATSPIIVFIIGLLICNIKKIGGVFTPPSAALKRE